MSKFLDENGLKTVFTTVRQHVKTEISNLVDSSPEALDTLKELADALGNDPNFATTVTTEIGKKLALSGGTMTGNIKMSSDIKLEGTSDYSLNAGSSTYSVNDGSGNNIVKTYATKQELGEIGKITNSDILGLF